MTTKLNILNINTFEMRGGAARAASRLHRALVDNNASARLLVRERYDTFEDVIKVENSTIGWLRGCLDILPNKCYPKRQLHNFSPAWVPDTLSRQINSLSPDIVHLHWVGSGFLRIENIARIRAPLVWTMHDSWPFTGGCHLSGECRKFEDKCGACPVLCTTNQEDLSRRTWRRKKKNYPLHRITFVAPSRWMAERARASSLLRDCDLKVIHNGVSVSQYAPGDRLAARDMLGLPQQRQLILFGAHHALSDHNKGFDLLCTALRKLTPELRARSTLVIFGEDSVTARPELGMAVINRGVISDEETIASLYRASDLFVVPSREENLPNMVSEAMSCGLPCVAFSVGGLGEQILHRINGCLAPPLDTSALAEEIAWLLENPSLLPVFARRARDHIVAEFSMEQVVRKHMELYLDLSEGGFPSEGGK